MRAEVIDHVYIIGEIEFKVKEEHNFISFTCGNRQGGVYYLYEEFLQKTRRFRLWVRMLRARDKVKEKK